MSIAGRILVVIIALTLILWIILASLVTELNSNWGKALQTVTADVQKVEEEIAQTREEIETWKNETIAEQVRKDKDILVLKSRLAKVEKAESDTKETLSRFQLQLESVNSSINGAQARLELRRKEKADTQQALAQEEANVDRLKAENAALMAQLQKLRDDFRDTMAANQAMVQRLLKANQPRVRAAGLIR